MIELFRDPLWQFIGVIIGILALTATVVIFINQRKRKSLSYEVISSSSLLSVKEEIEGKLRILYEDSPVKKVHLIVLRIFNSGNTPIETDDYERPISMSFGEGARIISHEVTEALPESLRIDYVVEDERIVFSPCLLNNKDSYNLKLLVSDYQGHIDTDARVSGVNDMKEESPGYSTSLAVASISALISLGGIVNIDLSSEPFFTNQEAIGFGLILAGYLLMAVAFATNRRLRKRILRMYRRLLS